MLSMFFLFCLFLPVSSLSLSQLDTLCQAEVLAHLSCQRGQGILLLGQGPAQSFGSYWSRACDQPCRGWGGRGAQWGGLTRRRPLSLLAGRCLERGVPSLLPGASWPFVLSLPAMPAPFMKGQFFIWGQMRLPLHPPSEVFLGLGHSCDAKLSLLWLG